MKRLLLAVALFAGSAVASGQSPGLAGATGFVYKRASGVDLKLWVFSPSGLQASDPRASILFFGGGGWINQTPAQFSPHARYFATKGLVAVVADYRVRATTNTSPHEAVADAKSAIRWLRAHASQLHIKPSAIAVGGGSAGGHIALAAAVVGGLDEPGEDHSISSRPNALVLFNPVPDTVPEPPFSPQQQGFVTLLGPRAREISPTHHLGRNLPPTIIFHGKADTLVPYAAAEAFCRKAVDFGNRCELVGFDGADHGFFNTTQNGGRWYYETLSGAERFLRDLGYIR